MGSKKNDYQKFRCKQEKDFFILFCSLFFLLFVYQKNIFIFIFLYILRTIAIFCYVQYLHCIMFMNAQLLYKLSSLTTLYSCNLQQCNASVTLTMHPPQASFPNFFSSYFVQYLHCIMFKECGHFRMCACSWDRIMYRRLNKQKDRQPPLHIWQSVHLSI